MILILSLMKYLFFKLAKIIPKVDFLKRIKVLNILEFTIFMILILILIIHLFFKIDYQNTKGWFSQKEQSVFNAYPIFYVTMYFLILNFSVFV